MEIIFLAILKKIVNKFFREASKPQSDSCSLFQIIFVPWEIKSGKKRCFELYKKLIIEEFCNLKFITPIITAKSPATLKHIMLHIGHNTVQKM